MIPLEILASGHVRWAINCLRTELIGSGLKVHIYSVVIESQLYTAFPWKSAKMRMLGEGNQVARRVKVIEKEPSRRWKKDVEYYGWEERGHQRAQE